MLVLLSGASEGLSRIGDGILGIAGIEATLPSLDHGSSVRLLDTERAERVLFESLQSTTAVAGASTYDKAGEFAMARDRSRSRTDMSPSKFFPTKYSLEFICISFCSFMIGVFFAFLLFI